MSQRLLHVIRSVNPADGGPVEMLKQSTESLVRMGHCVETVTLDDPQAPWLKNFPCPLHALGKGGSIYGYTSKLVPWLRRNAQNFDVVFTHGLWQFSNVGTWWALRHSKTPYFVFPHGMLDPWFRDAYPAKHRKKAVYWRFLEHRVLRDAAAVIYTCEEERRLGRETFRPYAAREKIVTLGIAEPSHDPIRCRDVFLSQWPSLRGKRLLLFLARIHPKKGCDMLIEAMRKVEHPWTIVMAGPCADEGYLRELKDRSTDLPITFTGMLEGEMKWGAFGAADAFILPSHQENFGIAVVEALAAGVPVLLSDKVNIWREIEADGAALVEPDTVEGTANLLRRAQSAELDTMRLAGPRCFRKRFTADSCAGTLLDLVEPSKRDGVAL